MSCPAGGCSIARRKQGGEPADSQRALFVDRERYQPKLVSSSVGAREGSLCRHASRGMVLGDGTVLGEQTLEILQHDSW